MIVSSPELAVVAKFVIDEEILDDGSSLRTYLGFAQDRLLVRDGTGLAGTLPCQVVVAIMGRYGKPLDDAVVVDGPVLTLSEGITLQGLRFRARVDACPRDYLVLNIPNREPLAVLSNVVASALRYFVRREHPGN